MRLREAKPFNVSDVIILKTARGKTKPFRRDPSGHEFFILRENRWIRQKDTKLTNWPRSVQYINDEVWTGQYDGTAQIFDRDLILLRMLSDQQWGTVCDVI